ncbi:MAG TPA: SIS domain-containing protein [Pedobacter sp.]|uniref:D-sedoheptulose-7-phosphate isomerase n=1 Tax=Pedobacter sp. TaxID=1411316 RepID=UPI002CE10F51|nr:SIS domain-containing protein [Pedobacter sp.]HMI04597.1 SIS domain-containing protein [Pedobacter sp.]
MKAFLKDYVSEQRSALESIPLDEVEKLIDRFKHALREDRQIFVFGNGGSAANASHMITDLGKGASDVTYRRFRCLSLNDNNNWLTAIGNDYCYDDIFLRQLQNYARPGDLVMVMSVSGNSPNLIKAIEWCSENNILTVALLGRNKGKLADIADQVIAVDSVHYGRVEDCHMHICHMICYAFMEIEHLRCSE